MKRSADTRLDGQLSTSKKARLDDNHRRVIFAPVQRVGEVFKYEPLPSSRNAFRLVQIKCLDLRGILWCEIACYETSKCPKYHAVSYCWGNVDDSSMIILNGRTFPVRRNLLSLLRNIGGRVKGQYLWIDAICIDQSSTEERNHQVRMMGQIYSGAREVIAWLGAMDEDCEEVVKYLRRACGSAKYLHPESCRNAPKLECLKNLLALKRFLEREYWHRTWIIQEIVLARRVQLICGTEVISWHRLRKLKDLWSQAYFPGADKAKMLGIDESVIFRLMHERSQQTSERLSQLIKRYRSSRCEDSRDKVYALLALAADCEEESTFNANYGRSLAQLFCDVMLFCKDIKANGRMLFAGQLQETLDLHPSEIQDFIHYEADFWWDAFRHIGTRVPHQIKKPFASMDGLQRCEGLLVGAISSSFTDQERVDRLRFSWANSTRIPKMDTYFMVEDVKDDQFSIRQRATGRSNLSFACIAKGDLVYQFRASPIALVMRASNDRTHDEVIALALTGGVDTASFAHNGMQIRTFLLKPSEILAMRLICAASSSRR